MSKAVVAHVTNDQQVLTIPKQFQESGRYQAQNTTYMALTALRNHLKLTKNLLEM